MNVTSSITDDDINAVKGKYLKDISPQADPYGGIFQGVESEGENTPDMPENLEPESDLQETQPNTPEIENAQ
jgi:hypothetical protein